MKRPIINPPGIAISTDAQTTYERHLRPALQILSMVTTAAAAIAGGLSLATYLGLVSLPFLPLIVVAAVGFPLGVIVLIFAWNKQKPSTSPPTLSAQTSELPAHSLPDSNLKKITPPIPPHEPPPIHPSPPVPPHGPIPGPTPITPTPPQPQSLEDRCNDIARTAYGKPFPNYEDMEVIPDVRGPRVKWISLSDEQKWQLFKNGSRGTGGRRAVSDIQRILNAGKPFSAPEIQTIIKNRLCTAGRISTVHGAGHAQRCAALISVLEPLYAKVFQFNPLADEERAALQVAAMFHDSGRQGDGSDVWEEISAQNAEAYLNRAGYPELICARAGNAIRGKNLNDPFTILLHEADCLEYMRVRGGNGFNSSHLAASRLPLGNGISEGERSALLQQIVAAEKQFIDASRDFKIDYKRYADCAASLFAAIDPAPPSDGRALQLVSQFAQGAADFAKKIGMSLPTEITALQSAQTVKIDWSAAANGCHLVLRQLGQNITNESNENAIRLGWNIESILICYGAIASGHISQAKLKSFASGLFNQTYTFSDGADTKVFKPIIPTSAPSDLDMDRRYGISQFTHIARELAPQELSTFLGALAAQHNIQIPNLFGQAQLGIVDGEIGLIMEKARGASLHDARGDQRNPNFRREETWLQLMDCLMGQYDRHSRNVFWDGLHVTAIDNDTSFSDLNLRLLSRFTDRNGRHRVTDPMRVHAQTIDLVNQVPMRLCQENGKRKAVDGLAGAGNYCMPPVIDEDMRQLIMAIDIGEFRQFLEQMGFTQGQIDTAWNRLLSMRKHINSGRTRIIARTAWGSDQLQECTPQNAYFMWHTR